MGKRYILLHFNLTSQRELGVGDKVSRKSWHSLKTDEALAKLESSPTNGLTVKKHKNGSVNLDQTNSKKRKESHQ